MFKIFFQLIFFSCIGYIENKNLNDATFYDFLTLVKLKFLVQNSQFIIEFILKLIIYKLNNLKKN